MNTPDSHKTTKTASRIEAVIGLTACAIVVGYAVLWYGGVESNVANRCLFALGILAFICCWRRWESSGPSVNRLQWSVLLVPAYAAAQLIPLPAAFLRILSPTRAELLNTLGSVVPEARFAPICVMPGDSFRFLLLVSGYLVIFFLMSEISRRLSDRPWMLVLPLMLFAAFEAALGLIQYRSDPAVEVARGTYVNRDHYAGLLEMALPFAIVYPLAALRRTAAKRSVFDFRYILAIACATVAILILLGIFYSLSRMGAVASLTAICVMAILSLRSGSVPRSQKFRLRIGLASILLLIAFLAPQRLLIRFGEQTRRNEMAAGRQPIWIETLKVIRDYPLVGCGIGTRPFAYLKYKEGYPFWTTDFGHNDYLQFIAELGFVGFLIIASACVQILLLVFRATSRASAPHVADLAIACTGSMTAILMHSLVDFNLYVPANAMVLAWVSGVSIGVSESSA